MFFMIKAILFIHVLFGILALLLGCLVLFLPKGTKFHARMGWGYFVAMAIIFVTSVVVSYYRGNVFLLLIGFFSFYMVHTGIRYRYLRFRSQVGIIDKLATVLYGLLFFLILFYAFYAFWLSNSNLGVVLLAFGGIGIALWRLDLRNLILKGEERLPWLNEHIGRLIGSYIACVTAFAVNNIHFEPSFIIWLGPTLIGVPLIVYFTKKYVR